MHILRTVTCALDPLKTAVILRDIRRVVNYASASEKVASETEGGVRIKGWNELPVWVDSLDIIMSGNRIILRLDINSDIETGVGEALATQLANKAEGLFSRPVREYQNRVFCIGWQKTGTTSLTEALRILGLFSWHFAPWVIGCDRINDSISQKRFDFADIVYYTAVSDLPVCALYKELDHAFPGSLFIYTHRPLAAWLSSVKNHLGLSLKRDNCIHAVDRWAYGDLAGDKSVLQQCYLKHQRDVYDYFKGRVDFLALDLNGDNPWNPLCQFLGLPEPSVPFPHLNRREKSIEGSL